MLSEGGQRHDVITKHDGRNCGQCSGSSSCDACCGRFNEHDRRVYTGLVVALLALNTWGEKLVLSRVSEAAGGAQKQVAAMTSALHRILIAFRTIKASNTRAYEEGEICRRAYSAYRSGVQMEKAKTIVQIIAFASLDLPFLVVLTVGTLR